MKTNEELKQLKQEYENLKTKLKELNEDELKEITGGSNDPIDINHFNPWEVLPTINSCVKDKNK